MKKILLTALILLPLTAGAVWWNPFTYFQEENISVSVGDGTITRLDQWASTSTPQTSITQRVMNSVLRFTGLGASGGCLSVDVNGILSASGVACGTSAGDITGGASIGTGRNIYDSESAGILRFNSISAGSNITLSTTSNSNTIVIASTASGSGAPAFDPTSYGASTSTILGLLGGYFSTASSTQSGNFFLPAITQGFLYTGSNGIVRGIASSSINLSWFNNDSAFITDGNTNWDNSYGFTTFAYPFPSAATTTRLTLSGGLDFTYSSSTIYSSFETASTSALVASNSVNLYGGGAKTTANALCIQLTQSADLCDGSDGGGAGGGYGFIQDAYGGNVVQSTTTTLWLKDITNYGLIASTTLIDYASTTQLSIGADWLTDADGTGLTISATGVLNVDASQNITTLSNLTGNGLVTTSGSNGTLGVTANATNGLILAMSGGIPTYVATTTFSTGLTYSAGNVVCDTASATVFGCLSTAKFSQFNSATTTAGTGLTYSGNAFNVNSSQSIGTLSNLTSNGFVKTSGGVGTLSVDTTAYLSSYDAWTHPGTGISATTSQLTVLGLLSTASSTISADLFLSSLTQGYSYVGSNGIVKTVSTSTLASQVFSATTFSPNSIITSNSSGNLIATGTQLTVGNIIATTSAVSYFMGNVGIGTAAPTSKLVVLEPNRVIDGVGNLNVFTSNPQAVDLGGQIGLGGANGSAGTFDPWSFATLKGAKENGTSANFAGYFAVGTPNSGGTITEKFRVTSAGNFGIGTTTPSWLLNPFSATTPQLALSAGAGIAQWVQRNAGGNLYFATTTVAGTATSSTAALELRGTGSPGLSIGSSTPTATLSVNPIAGGFDNQFAVGSSTATNFRIDNSGRIYMPNVAAGGAGDTDACLDATTNEIKDAGATACLVSSIRFKENIEPLTDSLTKILKLNPVGFTYKPELDSSLVKGTKRVGLIAEDMEKVETRLVFYEEDGVTPRGIDYESYTSILTGAIQEIYQMVMGIIDWNRDQDKSLQRLEKENAELKARLDKIENEVGV